MAALGSCPFHAAATLSKQAVGWALTLKSVAVAVAAMAVNVAASFLWVFVYSMLIEPGHDAAFYEAYAMRVAPWSSVIVGLPILFGAGWLLSRWHGGGWQTGLWAGVAYVLIDGAILAAAGMLTGLLAIEALSYATKLGAAALGGRAAGRRLAKA